MARAIRSLTFAGLQPGFPALDNATRKLKPVSAAPGVGQPVNYQVYFRDHGGCIVAGEAFAATDNDEAVEVVLALHSACSDYYERCELWRETQCIAVSSHRDLQRWSAVIGQLRRERQQRLLDLEELLETSYACLRDSKAYRGAAMRLRTNLKA